MKAHLIFLFSFITSFTVFSQAYTNTVMGAGGIFGDGYGGQITYNTNLNETNFTQIALDVVVDNFVSGQTVVPYSSYTASYSYFITLYSAARRKQVLSLGLGPVIGYELVNNGENDLSNIVSVDGESGLIYGGQATAEIDIIISEHYSLILRTTQFYHVNSDFGNLNNFSGLGIRYYFNK